MVNDLDQQSQVVSIATTPRRMPANWIPPAPAWSAGFPKRSTPVVMAYFGSQFEPGHSATHGHRICDFFAGADAPENVESGSFVDRSGRRNLLSVGYWTEPASYDRWKVDSGFEAWWNDPARLTDREGQFRETLIVPTDRFETIFSAGSVVGVARIGGPVVGPIREHNYWGSMRDRLQVSADSDLRTVHQGGLPRLGIPVTEGRRLRVTVPENLAVIRSGQNWSDCTGAELAAYDNSIRPALLEAMTFLRDHPEQTGCCDLRFAQGIQRDGRLLNETFGLGCFLSLEHLEKWAAAHPMHLAIFASFGRMVRRFGADLKLKLWHEVAVLPASNQTFEYINCHPETGLLPYFPSVPF